MAQVSFGSQHTIEKLDKLESYLKAFLRVFKNQPWARTVYIDAFAGTGEIPITSADPTLPLDEEAQAFIVGSVRRALGLSESFGEYVFIEKKKKNAKELEQLRISHPSHKITVINKDANEALQDLCRSYNWSLTRAVVFLDPFGSQVEWKTIEAIAATKAIDLWYLFPAGLSVHRQIRKKDGTAHTDHQASLDRILGTTTWRQSFAKEIDIPALFDNSTRSSEKAVTAESATTMFMVERMRTIFKGGVLNEWLPLGSGKVHMFSLLFAWANPSPSAKKAGDIAKAVLRSEKRGRAK